MTIKKIHIKQDKVHIEWTKTMMRSEKPIEDPYTMGCSEDPKPSFHEALQALKDHVISICGFTKEYGENMKISGVTFSGDDDDWGATITAIKTLKQSNVPFVIHTPWKPATVSEGGTKSKCLSDACVEALQTLIDEARGYVAGDRAQGKLFDDVKPAEGSETDPNYRVSRGKGSNVIGMN